MNKAMRMELLTVIIASALTHYREYLKDPNAQPPNPEESKAAYINDPGINLFTDALAMGISMFLDEIEKENQS